MAGSFHIDGGNVVLTFTYSPTIQKGQNMIDLISQYLYNEPAEGPSWDQLTNQQKLDLVDAELARFALQLADIQRRNLGRQMAQDAYPIDL